MCNTLSEILLCKMVKINIWFDVQREKLQLCGNTFPWKRPRQANEALLYLQNVQHGFQVLAGLKVSTK